MRKRARGAAFDAPARVRALDAELRAAGSSERAEFEKRYLKSSLKHYGSGVPAVRKLAKRTLRATPDLRRTQLLALVREAWRAPVHERRLLAVELLIAGGELLEARDLALLERLLREARGWALVDGLAIQAVGPLVARFPALTPEIDRWARDPDFWLRRSALLSLLRGLRRDCRELERFTRYADAMLDEKEFFIRKALGWVLRELSKHSPERVSAWLRPRRTRLSGVTLREATKYLAKPVSS